MKKSLREKIEKLLRENPDCRDNDTTLCAEIWKAECEEIGYDLVTMTAINFIILESSGEISKKQSILRCRRGLNQKKPETVGKSYKSNLKPKRKELRILLHNNQIQNLDSNQGKYQFPNTINLLSKRRMEQNVDRLEGLDPKFSVLTG